MKMPGYKAEIIATIDRSTLRFHPSGDLLLEGIKRSTEFSLGDVRDTRHLFPENDTGEILFAGPRAVGRLPYTVTLVSFKPRPGININRSAVLCVDAPRATHCVPLYRGDASNNMWTFQPWTIEVVRDETGRTTGECNAKATEEVNRIFGEGAAQEDEGDMNMVWLLLTLLECKNISHSTVTPDAKLNRARRKRGAYPHDSYHVLHITTPGNSSGTNQDAHPHHQTRAHMCRGHFKRYTAEKPLLGKHTGLYWWQPHLRGNASLGTVSKDYRVSHQ